MTRLRGVDGCKAGWLCISQDLATGEIAGEVFADAAALFTDDEWALTAIDLPLRLPKDSSRACDHEARKLLGSPAGSTVFPTPVRATLATTSYRAACQASFERCGKKLSRQTYAILPRIRSVDAVLQGSAALRERVFEIHPEVSFCLWNEKRLGRSKHSGFGFLQRLDLVRATFGGAAESIRAATRPKAVADDDILDAFAALWTARRIHTGTATLLGDPTERDIFDLPMVIYG